MDVRHESTSPDNTKTDDNEKNVEATENRRGPSNMASRNVKARINKLLIHRKFRLISLPDMLNYLTFVVVVASQNLVRHEVLQDMCEMKGNGIVPNK